MNTNVKAFVAGLGISFIGSIPLGYLNIIAYSIYTEKGIYDLIYFLLGIIAIESPIIYVIFKFTGKIASNTKFTKILEVVSITFLIAITLAVVLKKNDSMPSLSHSYLFNSAFITGILLNATNVLQLPFWSGWSLYVVNNSIVDKTRTNINLFITGTGMGTFLGMATFVFILSKISNHIYGITNSIIAIIFVSLICFQSFRFFNKYYIINKRSLS